MQFVFILSTDVVISMFEKNILEFYLNIFIFHLDFNTILAMAVNSHFCEHLFIPLLFF